jgi:hypothetical protein
MTTATRRYGLTWTDPDVAVQAPAGVFDKRAAIRRQRALKAAGCTHVNAMACLGATLRGEKLPEATQAWKDADGHMKWMVEEERRAHEGE